MRCVSLLARVDALARAGAWCVGYLCYEAAGAFDEAFETHAPADPARPLAAFAVYDAPLPDASAFDTADTRYRALDGCSAARCLRRRDRARSCARSPTARSTRSTPRRR